MRGRRFKKSAGPQFSWRESDKRLPVRGPSNPSGRMRVPRRSDSAPLLLRRALCTRARFLFMLSADGRRMLHLFAAGQLLFFFLRPSERILEKCSMIQSSANGHRHFLPRMQTYSATISLNGSALFGLMMYDDIQSASLFLP